MTEPCEGAPPDSVGVLLVGEDEHTAKRLFDVLSRPGGTRFEVTHVPRVEDALSKLQQTSYDVLLLDLSIHESHGLDSLLRARVAARSIPIVVLTYRKDEEVALKAARAGAQDYLTKGEVTPELITRTLLHAVERHRILRELTEAKQRAHILATHDSLTGIPNRYAFLDQLEHALADAARAGSQLGVMFLDLDGFKQVNDTLGHAGGDELLVEVARRLRREIRKSDLLARLGGDEFVAAIRNVSDPETLALVAEKLREDIGMPYNVSGRECSIGVSIGISLFPRDGGDADRLIHSADAAMYGAKSSGKNQVCHFPSVPDAESE